MKMNKRQQAINHESFIARSYGGRRSPSSGAAISDKGDVLVRSDGSLFECKASGSPGSPKRPKIIKDLEKVATEAYEEGREPALALRFFNPDSILADKTTGYVDVVVRLVGDDVRRGNGGQA